MRPSHGRRRRPSWVAALRAPLRRLRALRRAPKATELALAVIVVASVLAVGSVHLPVLVAVAALCALAAALVWTTHPERPPGARSLPLIVLVALSLYTALQAVPLPARWVGQLAPEAANVWRRSLLPFGGDAPRWTPVSLDPGASVVEAMKWFSYAAVFFVASRIAARRGAAWGVGVVFLAGVLAAMTTIAHGLLDATTVYGLYRPRFAVAAWHVGPLLNPNNLAGYLNLSALCGLGMLAAQRPSSPRWAVGCGVAVLIAVNFSSGSRGGALALAIGVVTLAVLLVRARRRETGPALRQYGWLLPVVLAGGGLAFLGGTEHARQELLDENFEKALMVEWAAPLVRDFRWFGIGRGAFESVFPAYRIGAGNTVYSHAENFVVQWVSEWGLPVGVTALVAFAWSFRPKRCGVGSSATSAGAWVGALVLGIHNLFDLAFEVPGVMIGLTTALGSAWGASRDRDAGSPALPAAGRVDRGAWPRPALAMGAGALAILAALLLGRHDVRADRAGAHELYSRGTGTAAERSKLLGELSAAVRRHPAEPYFPLLGALVAWRGGDADPVPFVARAIERGPDNGRAHLLLADVLASRGARRQALMHLRFAVEREPELTAVAAIRAQRLVTSDGDLEAAVPTGRAGVALLVALATAQPEGKSRQRRELLSRALERNPAEAAAHAGMAGALLAELALGDASEECGGDGGSRCASRIEGHAEAVERGEPRSSAGARLRARLLHARGDARAAQKLLAERCAVAADKVECLEARLRIAAQVTPPDQLPAAIKEYMLARCSRADDCGSAAIVVGDIEATRGEWGAALGHYGRATRESPTEESWLKLATAAERVGAHAQAADALEKVMRLKGGADPTLRARIDELRAAALKGALE